MDHESWWSLVVLPVLQSRSLRHPLPMFEEGDYSHFERFRMEIPEYMRPHIPPDPRRRGSKETNDLRKIMTESFRFSSDPEPGLELADIVVITAEAEYLVFDENDANLRFTVIDGQHRVNGGYLALKLLQEEKPDAKWDNPAEVFLNLDEPNGAPRKQAQIFIGVNFYQKRVDRSLVADLFPTTRLARDPENERERAQDIGRRLMLETGPLVGMIQIPGIKYGVQGVVALATLVGAIEDVLPHLNKAGLNSLNSQTEFVAEVLSSWLSA